MGKNQAPSWVAGCAEKALRNRHRVLYTASMVLAYIADPLDEEDSRGHFYHVCLGVLQKDEVFPPPPDEPIACTACGVELEHEDFLDAQMKGSA